MIKNGIIISKDSGSGKTTVTISADVNEGIDSETIIKISVSDSIFRELTVRREGKREIFNASDGSFLLADGDTFNVLKIRL